MACVYVRCVASMRNQCVPKKKQIGEHRLLCAIARSGCSQCQRTRRVHMTEASLTPAKTTVCITIP